MSGTTTPPAPTAPTTEPIWAKPSVSLFSLGIFVAAFVIAKLANDNSALLLMYGAAIGMANQVVNYYLGSSSSSARKTELAAPPAPPTGTPTP